MQPICSFNICEPICIVPSYDMYTHTHMYKHTHFALPHLFIIEIPSTTHLFVFYMVGSYKNKIGWCSFFVLKGMTWSELECCEFLKIDTHMHHVVEKSQVMKPLLVRCDFFSLMRSPHYQLYLNTWMPLLSFTSCPKWWQNLSACNFILLLRSHLSYTNGTMPLPLFSCHIWCVPWNSTHSPI